MAVLVTLGVMLAAPGLVATVMAQDTSAATDNRATAAPAAEPMPAVRAAPLDLSRVFADTARFLQDYLPRLLLSIVILVVGTVIVWLIAALVRWLMGKATLDNRLARYVKGGAAEARVGSERVVSWIVFWILELFVLVLFFHFLQMAAISESLSRVVQQILDYVPRLFGAGLLLLAGWILAAIVKFLITRALVAAKVDDRFKGNAAPAEAGARPRLPLSKTLGSVVFWVILLLFVPGVLSALAIEGLSTPMQQMVEKVVTFLPNVGLAVIILLLGWLFAGLVRRIVEGLMQAAGTDRLGERAGLGHIFKKFNLSALVGLVVYILILVPVIIAALNALQVEGITKPASDMLGNFLAAVPSIFSVLLILLIAYIGGRLLSRLATSFMEAIGFDRLPAALGLAKKEAAAPPAHGAAKSAWSPSQVVGYVVLVVIMLFAIMESCRRLDFVGLAAVVSAFVLFLTQVLLGLAVLALGLYFGNVVAKAILGSQVAHARWLAMVARVAIIVFASAMALNKIGVGADVVKIAFGLAFGAIAVAAAIAFGLGGRDAAARQIEEWSQKKTK
jgi:hypothetical protein